MRKCFLGAVFLAVFLFLGAVVPSEVRADCRVANFDQGMRDLQVCVGEFDTKAELRSTVLRFECMDNSNLDAPVGIRGSCRSITGPTNYELSSTPDNHIATDGNGKFYTCPIIQGVNRAIGILRIDFFKGGSLYCSVTKQTAPDDWDRLTEGMAWHQGTTNPTASGDVFCLGEQSIDTALGCIPIDRDAFTTWFLNRLFGIIGGIAFLLMIGGGIQMSTSGGDPAKMKAGQEMLSSAIAGLVFALFSLFILRLIMVDILHIPGIN